MREHHFLITDRLWRRIAPCFQVRLRIVVLPQETTICFSKLFSGECARDAPWWNLPADLRNGNSQLDRFRRWAASGVVQWVFEALSGDPDLMEVVRIDGTIVPVHQKAAGPKGELDTSPLGAPAAL